MFVRNPPPRRRWTAVLDTATKVLGLLTLLSICFEYGFYVSPVPAVWLHAVQVAAVAAYVLSTLFDLLLAPRKREALRRHRMDLFLILTAALALAAVQQLHRGSRLPLLSASALYIGTLQAFILIRIGIAALQFDLQWSQRRLAPGRTLTLGFLTVILVGGTLLWALPKATTPELSHQTQLHFARHVLNCYFTATSATCVTGLVVYDTQKDFTLFGQLVILAMIQVGGLGIMMFGSFFGLLIGRQFSLHQSLMLQDTLSHRTIGQVRQMVRFIVVATFVLEALGAALLYRMWPESVGGPWMRVYYSAFHAISAFCNAGFALHADSLIPYRHCWSVYVSIMPLIVVGGLGFPVLADLSAYARSRVRWRPLSRFRRPDDTTFLLGWSDAPAASGATVVMPRKHRLSLHTKAALTTSAILVAGGALLLLVSESAQRRSPEQKRQLTARAETGAVPPAMMDLPLAERALAALFQSVTARTAGFNTIALDVDSFSSAGHFVFCILMFVGGSPGSTAGGIKTITAFVIIMAVVSTLRGRDNVEAFRRAIPVVVLRRASVVLICMLALVCASTLLLSLTERVPLLEVLFESVSASGTVGLSTGLTARLTVLGKVIIMLTMFSGRLGPLTLLLAVTGGEAPARFDYPRESVVIG